LLQKTSCVFSSLFFSPPLSSSSPLSVFRVPLVLVFFLSRPRFPSLSSSPSPSACLPECCRGSTLLALKMASSLSLRPFLLPLPLFSFALPQRPRTFTAGSPYVIAFIRCLRLFPPGSDRIGPFPCQLSVIDLFNFDHPKYENYHMKIKRA
jgi:hypothetical protein